MKICDTQEFSLKYTAWELIMLSQAWSHLIGPLTLFLSNHFRLGDAGAWGLQNGRIEVIKQSSLKKQISLLFLSIFFLKKYV